MNTDPLSGLKRQQKLVFGLFLLAALMATMKGIGIFAEGVFPWYTQAALSIFLLIVWSILTDKIRKAQANMDKDDATKSGDLS